MSSSSAEAAFLRDRIRLSSEMAANAFDPRAALAHEQMNYCYRARLADLQQSGTLSKRVATLPFEPRLRSRPRFDSVSSELMLFAG